MLYRGPGAGLIADVKVCLVFFLDPQGAAATEAPPGSATEYNFMGHVLDLMEYHEHL